MHILNVNVKSRSKCYVAILLSEVSLYTHYRHTEVEKQVYDVS